MALVLIDLVLSRSVPVQNQYLKIGSVPVPVPVHQYQKRSVDWKNQYQYQWTNASTGWPKSHAQTLSANNSAHTHLFAMRFFALNQAQFNLEFRFLLFYFDQNDAFYGYFTKVHRFGSSFWSKMHNFGASQCITLVEIKIKKWNSKLNWADLMHKTASQINAYELSYSRSKSGRDFWATLYNDQTTDMRTLSEVSTPMFCCQSIKNHY